MTTDRTAASTRSTALATPPAAGRTPAPPTDMFSALLGAATPKSDAPARREDTPRRDDRPRADKPHRHDDARRSQPRDDAPKPAKTAEEPTPTDATAPADAPATTDPAAEEKPTAPTTPSLFALQLASPLPPQPAAPAQAPETQPLPVLAGQIPASLAGHRRPGDRDGRADGLPSPRPRRRPPTETAADGHRGRDALNGLPAEATADTTLPADFDAPKPQAQVDDAARRLAGQAAGRDAAVDRPAADAGAISSRRISRARLRRRTPPRRRPSPLTLPRRPSPPRPARSPRPPRRRCPPRPACSAPCRSAARSLTTGVMVHMMADKGVNHARLNLKPAELGGIEVRLRSTGDGVHALLVADSPEAARMLASAGDDLKRQLEDKNVNLLSLDVSTSGQRQDQPAGFNTDGFGDDRYRPGSSNMSRSSGNESALLMETPEGADTVLVLPDGVHVDVLA